MGFSSISAYLDPSNWQQQAGYGIPNPQLQSPPRPPAVAPQLPTQPHMGVGGNSIRPGSMVDRARVANIPMPEAAQKCPRCESTNTKFCYFNNYSLSQPRHFCKTCRRYWTRGGALRSVPVGGGCRRNKRSSSGTKSNNNNNNNTSKSTASSTSTTSNNNSTFSSPTSTASLLGLMTPQITPLRFMSPLGQMNDHHFTPNNENITTNYSTISSSAPVLASANIQNMNFQLGNMGSNVDHQWRLQQQALANQIPNFYGGLEGLYQIQGGGFEIRSKFSTPMLTQMASMKMEDNTNQDHSSRPILGNENCWTSATGNLNANWNELSASFSSSSTSNAL